MSIIHRVTRRMQVLSAIPDALIALLARFSLLSHSFYPMALAGLTPFIAAPTTPAGTPLSLQDSFYSCRRGSLRSFR